MLVKGIFQFMLVSETTGMILLCNSFLFHSRPGLYFFMTEGAELGRRHFCAVHVRDTNREFRVEIQDRSYQPMILLIEEGDRVWWSWDKQKVVALSKKTKQIILAILVG